MIPAGDVADIGNSSNRANHATTDEHLTPRDSPKIILFRNFKVLITARKLLRDGREVALGGRAFDLLLSLLGARGRVLSKNELMREVWPTTIVDECSLRFQIAVLRRALGRDRDLVKTIPGRGYLIVEDFQLAPEPAASKIAERSHHDHSAGFCMEPHQPSSPPPHLGLPVHQIGSHEDAGRRLLEMQAEITRLKIAMSQLTLARCLVPE